MSAAKLRRTFHYPSESDDEDAIEHGLDAQDQETLISTLAAKDTSSTKTYTALLLALPLAPIPFYLPRLFIDGASFVVSVASIASLLASAYALYYMPLPPVRVGIISTEELKARQGRGGARAGMGGYAWTAPRNAIASTKAHTSSRNETRTPPYLSPSTIALLSTYLIPANTAICALLTLYHFLFAAQGSSWTDGTQVGGGYLPGLIWGVVLAARRELRTVDFGELEGLRAG